MISYDEALSIARGHKSKINHCIEYSNAYSFEYDAGEKNDGGDEPIVVLKESGQIMKQIEYAVTANKSFVRDFKVD